MHAGDVDFHFFIWYSWKAGKDNPKNTAFAEQNRLQYADHVIGTQASTLEIWNMLRDDARHLIAAQPI